MRCAEVGQLWLNPIMSILRHRRKQQKGASSQYLGVAYHPKKQCWQAYVRVQGRLCMVGQFASEQEAAQARDQRVLDLGFSPLVRLNFPGETAGGVCNDTATRRPY